jgi:hypothetical protein
LQIRFLWVSSLRVLVLAVHIYWFLTGNRAIDPRTAIATARGHGIFMILVLFIFCTKTFKISTENLILNEAFQMEFSFDFLTQICFDNFYQHRKSYFMWSYYDGIQLWFLNTNLFWCWFFFQMLMYPFSSDFWEPFISGVF